MSEGTGPVRVVFVCWGNICRSPIAERVAQRKAEEAGLSDVEFTSAATSDEELGSPMDRRAAAVLRDRGYDPDSHVSHQVDAAEIAAADLVVAMEDLHIDRLRRLAPDADNLTLLTDFDPAATPGSGVPDPWYGTPEGFYDTLSAVEAAIPGVLDRVRELQASRWM